MAVKGKKSTKAQLEVPGTQHPARIDELHALGIEIKDVEQERMELTKREKEKRQMAKALLIAHKLKEYDVDGVHVWLEPQDEKVKVKLDGGPEDEE